MARLIDADALKKEIVDFKLNLHPRNQDYGTGYFSALSVVEGMLAYAPHRGCRGSGAWAVDNRILEKRIYQELLLF